MNIAQYNREGKKRASKRKESQKGKKKTYPPTPFGLGKDQSPTKWMREPRVAHTPTSASLRYTAKAAAS
ncbi:MAG: hypothetical protein IJV69_05395 [Kiritimatiellae bacterium]|nr:hypothetical protein [Kiritimatiellia bacterium]